MKTVKRVAKKSKRYAKTAYSTAETAMKAYTIAKSVAALVNSEYKYVQWANNGVVVDDNTGSGPVHRFFNANPQNTTSGGHEGDSIRVKNVVIRGSLHHTGGAAPSKPTQVIRMILIRDISNTIGTVGDLMESPANIPTSQPWALPYMVYNKNNKKKFQVLLDRTWNLSDDRPNAAFKITKKIDKHLVFNEGATSVASGEIKLFVFCNEPSVSAANSKPYLELYTHVSYIDN